MTKLMARDYCRVVTTTRGTVGYLASEWINGMPVTPKVDVYAYGMLLLENLSGRMNSQEEWGQWHCRTGVHGLAEDEGVLVLSTS
jgi:hypothetical protein